MLLFAGLLLITLKAPTTLGLVCFVCNDSPTTHCSIVKTCGQDEICYVDEFTNHGYMTYQLGCRDRQRCQTVLSGKRDNNLVCSQCCDQPWCQAGLCGGYAADRGVMCYYCPQGLENADDCQHVIEARSDEACQESLLPFNGTNGPIQYVADLVVKSQCPRLMAIIVGKRQTAGSNDLCYNCCSGDLCNDHCLPKNQPAQVCQDHLPPERCLIVANAWVCAERARAFLLGCMHTCGFC